LFNKMMIDRQKTKKSVNRYFSRLERFFI